MGDLKYSKRHIEKEEFLTGFIDDLVRSEKARIQYVLDNFKKREDQYEFLNLKYRTFIRRIKKYGL